MVVEIWIKARYHFVRMLVFVDFFSLYYYLFVIFRNDLYKFHTIIYP